MNIRDPLFFCEFAEGNEVHEINGMQKYRVLQ